MANRAPSPPTSVRINDKVPSDGMATKSVGAVKVSAVIDDPNAGQRVRMIVRYSSSKAFNTFTSVRSSYHRQGTRATVYLTGLSQNVHYYARLYTQDSGGMFSKNYNSVDFWTNRMANPPEIVTPADNIQFLNTLPLAFDWKHSDPDGDKQRGWEIRWRPSLRRQVGGGLSLSPGAPTAAPWKVTGKTEAGSTYTAPAGTFQSNQFYDWQIRTQDPQRLYGEWSDVRSFYVEGVSTPPTLLAPINGVAIDVSEDNAFRWRFNDPDPADTQSKADLRYRPVGADESAWVYLLGDLTDPGTATQWLIPADTFQPNVHYEWTVRTYDTLSGGDPSDWRDPEDFYSVHTPGSLNAQPPVPDAVDVQGTLGIGHNRVFVYDRGGQVVRGEITNIASVQWGRNRDDISTCLLTTDGIVPSQKELLSNLHTWQHEVVIFRNGERVWEGPVTRIEFRTDAVEIDCKDVMAWVYRRIMRQGYNDAFHIVDGVQIGLRSVVRRAAQITMNALAPDDPNVLGYMTLFEYPGDAVQSRVVPDFSKTAWEEIDDLAATAGLDYTTLGRRIMYWDTHRSIGRLPEMRDGDFSDNPIVSEYGMSLANAFAVTNGNGVWGEAKPEGEKFIGEYYGIVEQLASAYGEADGASDELLTAAARASLIAAMEDQAKRNIGGRWPAPVIVRVPDNTTLNPEVPVTINQLVPGVWIPVRSTGTIRSVAQWQKLDSITVTETSDSETVQLVMSPAPNGGQDPDADQAAEEDAG